MKNTSSSRWWQRTKSSAHKSPLQQKSFGYAASHAAVSGVSSYMVAPGRPVWTPRDYGNFALEAYSRNVIAFRAVTLIAEACGGVIWRLLDEESRVLNAHPALQLLRHPNPCSDTYALIEALVSFRLIAGNAYLHATGPANRPPLELHILRPDRVQVIAGTGCMPSAYRITHLHGALDVPVDRVSGQSRVLHWKHFHPLNEWYGMSPIEAAAYSIDQHNQASQWNQALLQNGARPSGAVVVNNRDGSNALSESQYQRLKEQIEQQFSGAANAGRPLLLEGGLEWKEMSLNPKDMDFLNTKHSAARDIALAFGVPPQLLGIPGDNTYSNLQEARLALWEQTILPLLDNLGRALSHWLLPLLGADAHTLRFDYDRDSISALTPRRDAYWTRINEASFLSDAEKRKMLLG